MASDSIFKQRVNHSRHSGMVRRTRPGISRFRVRCFASPRNDGVWVASLAMTVNSTHTIALATRSARVVAFIFRPQENRGRGECRVPAAPAASCALCSSRSARVTTSTPESPGIPARNGFNGVCRALPGDRALLPPSSCEYGMSAPGRADMPPQNLTPASGRQNHTI